MHTGSYRSRRQIEKGFSLLEILIAMAVLAFSLVALSGTQMVAITSSEYSNKVSQAAFLLESKLLEVEHKILTDSIDIYDNCDSGDFRDEGFKSFSWEVCTEKLEFQEGASQQLAERFGAILFGAGGDGNSGSTLNNLSGSGALSQFGMNLSEQQQQVGADGMNPLDKMMGQMAQAFDLIPTFLTPLEEQIRKVKLEVSWTHGTNQRRKIFVQRFITSLGAEGGNGAPPPEDNLANENKNQLEETIQQQQQQQLPGVIK